MAGINIWESFWTGLSNIVRNTFMSADYIMSQNFQLVLHDVRLYMLKVYKFMQIQIYYKEKQITSNVVVVHRNQEKFFW